MQTFIADYNFNKSAQILDIKRFFSTIYESIHILVSLLDITDELVNPKKNIKNYLQAKLWKDYEYSLFDYIAEHIFVWILRTEKSERKY